MTPASPRIRAPRRDERAAIAAIVRSDATFNEGEVKVALELVDSALEQRDDYELLVAELTEGRLGGYICFGPTPMTRGTWDLYWIVVDANVRGRGLAKHLILGMEAVLLPRGARHVRVETSETESYGAARALYERLGYPVASLLADFYAPGDGLLTYYKTLVPR